ncbi:DNA-directed RNA polymerase III subunit RPC2 isoform X2 [Galendromus occidentalis]|uniref:DNA-directed RNA polymerase subunit beta n=1 Tax=Galendromus occidentalis TaxID=34638 RepID=A0AAJ7SHS7_9ACAR|nr:DNA-directed RNA polymerase III subunit RPC2 isoform X2 [Galendromus occidentalis]
MGCLDGKDGLVAEFLKTKGLVLHHIASFDYFVETEMREILEANAIVYSEADPNWYMEYTDIRIGTPSIVEGPGMIAATTPYQCRLRDMTYFAPIYVDIAYKRGNELVIRNELEIGRMPIMLKSKGCVLHSKTPWELTKLRECPNDHGGYFIVKGVERVVLMAEQLANNRILIDEDSKGVISCQVTSSTHERKSRTNVIEKNGKFYVKHNSFVDDIPVVVMFRAMGVQNDLRIHQMIGTEENIQVAFVGSMVECHKLHVFTQEQALRFLAAKMKSRVFGPQKVEDPLDKAWEAVLSSVINHIPAQPPEYNMRLRAHYLGLMVRRIIQAKYDRGFIDDRDYYGNKRVELPGSMISLLFEDLLKRVNSELKTIADKQIPMMRVTQFDIVKFMKPSTITTGLINAISTGNWIIRRFNMHTIGVTQVLSRLNYISCLGMMTRVNSHFEKSRKVSGPRSLQPSQFGMLCPSDTPEGEACGLVKNMALLAHITINSSADLTDFFISLGVQDVRLLCGAEFSHSHIYHVFHNGVIKGVIEDHRRFIEEVRQFRRKGFLSPYLSVYPNHIHRCVYIVTDGGRFCRPFIIVENERPRVTSEHLEDLNSHILNFQDFLDIGLVEFLDVNEENDALIAVYEKDITDKTTHLEIAPFTILSACAGIIPFPHHNQSPRNTYQCAMGKQAMGVIGYNQHMRIDTLQYNMVFPQRPLVSTKAIKLINFDRMPAGQNVCLAVMSYSGYDIEDAIVLNKNSMERGFGECRVVTSQKCQLRRYPNMACDRILGPLVDASTRKPIFDHQCLDYDGIVMPGETVVKGQVLINRHIPAGTASLDPGQPIEYKEMPLRYQGTVPAQIDRVMVSVNADGETLFKVVMSQTRKPEIGDKFSSRHGQKGVVGLIVGQEDMPFDDQGVVPDIIMNPHGFPSRMTVGKMIEILAGKAAALSGEVQDATAFENKSEGEPVTCSEMGELLQRNGFHFQGKDILTCGVNGQPMQAYIYRGTCYYQRLKHMVQDKMHARARGPRAVLTRQPTEGRSRDGGLRLGEMERDCLIGHGAAMLLRERLMFSSDATEVDICNVCGLIGFLK